MTAFDLERVATPYVIVGGVATALYMPERMTLDLDLLILPGDERKMEEEIKQAGGVFQGALSVGGTSWLFPDGSKLDVLTLQESWVPLALQTPKRSPSGLPVVALPYLILMKLASGRAQDIADMSRMLGQADQQLRSEVRDTVARYRPEDAEDVESLIILGDLELP